jgi:type IV secretory pathway component VirB8
MATVIIQLKDIDENEMKVTFHSDPKVGSVDTTRSHYYGLMAYKFLSETIEKDEVASGKAIED